MMKREIFKTLIGICTVILCVYSSGLYSQATSLGNTIGSPSYLGWNNTVNIPLRITHRDFQDIRFQLNGISRFIIGREGQFNLENSASVPLSFNAPFFYFESGDEFSKLHLIDSQSLPNQLERTSYVAEVRNSNLTHIALRGNATAIEIDDQVIGVFGGCDGQTSPTVGLTRAVWASAQTCQPAAMLSALFEGDVFTFFPNQGPSDANLKENIEDLGAEDLGLLRQIEPKTYYFNQDVPAVKLPSNKQYGMIAQNVDSLFPSLTLAVTHPGDRNDEGERINDAYEYSAVDYKGFVSLLVKGWQNQQEELTSQQSQIDSISDAIATLESSLFSKVNENKVEKSSRVDKFAIYPNPVQGVLTVEAGFSELTRASIELYDLNMRLVGTLLSESSLNGNNKFQFDLDSYPSGFYLIVLKTPSEMFSLKLQNQ
jgi:hypothetical protein